jgi:hypothetical protein
MAFEGLPFSSNVTNSLLQKLMVRFTDAVSVARKREAFSFLGITGRL